MGIFDLVCVHPNVHPFMDCVLMGVLEVFGKYFFWDLFFIRKEFFWILGWGKKTKGIVDLFL